MTITIPGIREDTLALVHREIDAAQAELCRVDNKAAMLLAFVLGLLTALAALLFSTPHLTAAGHAAIWCAGGVLAVAVALLLRVVGPRIPRTGGTGFVAHARAGSGQAIVAALSGEPTIPAADHLHHLSRIVLSKYVALRWAVRAIRIALPLMAVALILITGGHP